jgi:hypothetical protein
MALQEESQATSTHQHRERRPSHRAKLDVEIERIQQCYHKRAKVLERVRVIVRRRR